MIERRVRAFIPFLEWRKISENMMRRMGFMGHELQTPVFISPDVKSLHIVWICDGDVFHEIEDWPEYFAYKNVEAWLADCILDDCWDMFEYNDLEDYFDGAEMNDIKVIETWEQK